MTHFEVLCRQWREETNGNYEKQTHRSWCPDLDPNRVPPKYKPVSLQDGPSCLGKPKRNSESRGEVKRIVQTVENKM